MGLYPKVFWIVDKNLVNIVQRDKIDSSGQQISNMLLWNCQQAIPFEIRAYLFKLYMSEEKDSRQENMFSMLHASNVQVRREYLLEDAFDKLYGLNEDIKNRFRIQNIDANYMTEEVIGGGLFKEFMTKLTEIIFDPQYSYFSETYERKLYPNFLSKNINDCLKQVTLSCLAWC